MSDIFTNLVSMNLEEIELEELPKVESRYKKKRTPYSFRNRDRYGMLYDILTAITETHGLSTTRIAYTVSTHEKIIKKYLKLLIECGMIKEVNNPDRVKDLRTISGVRVYFEITDHGKEFLQKLLDLFNMLSKDFFISELKKSWEQQEEDQIT